MAVNNRFPGASAGAVRSGQGLAALPEPLESEQLQPHEGLGRRGGFHQDAASRRISVDGLSDMWERSGNIKSNVASSLSRSL